MLSRTFCITAGVLIVAAGAALAQSPPARSTAPQPPAATQPDDRDYEPRRGYAGRDFSGQDDVGRYQRREDRGGRNRGASGVAACRADIQDLCGSVPGGRGERLQCLIESRDRVSPDCADMLAAIEGRPERGQRRSERFDNRRAEGGERAERQGGPRGGACRADAQSLCGKVERGPARRQCLREHEAELSPQCRDALARSASRQNGVMPEPQPATPR